MAHEKKKILIVEDEVDLAVQLQKALLSLGVEVTLGHSGTEAFEKLKFENFNVIVTDVGLPEMGGLQLLSHVRARGLNTPVILISGNADKEMAIQGIKLGAYDFIEKPFHTKDIIQAVKRALEKSETHFHSKLESLDLSQVQLKILELVFKGAVNKDIATQVNLSEHGVKYHMALLFQRFSAKSRGELKNHIRQIIDK